MRRQTRQTGLVNLSNCTDLNRQDLSGCSRDTWRIYSSPVRVSPWRGNGWRPSTNVDNRVG